MRRLVLCSFTFLVACNPPAVDSNADFIIKGLLTDASGDPAANTTFHVYRADVPWTAEQNFLQYFDIDSNVAGASFSGESDETGNFSLTLKGSDVNSPAGGTGHLSAVHFDGGDASLAYLATASDWFYFQDADPEIDVGELRLWDFGSASQSGDLVDFSWSADAPPTGYAWETGLPTFLFAYNSGELELQWASYSVDENISVPAAAFESIDGPEFFMTAFTSKGSQTYQHRSGLHVTSSWTGVPRTNDYMKSSEVKIYDANGDLVVGGQYKDGDPLDTLDFVGETTRFIEVRIDLGTVRSYEEILIYNLGVRYMNNALVSVETSATDSSSVPNDFDRVGDVFDGSGSFENWAYLGIAGGGSARWILLRVDRPGNTGSVPYLEWVGEIHVPY